MRQAGGTSVGRPKAASRKRWRDGPLAVSDIAREVSIATRDESSGPCAGPREDACTEARDRFRLARREVGRARGVGRRKEALFRGAEVPATVRRERRVVNEVAGRGRDGAALVVPRDDGLACRLLCEEIPSVSDALPRAEEPEKRRRDVRERRGAFERDPSREEWGKKDERDLVAKGGEVVRRGRASERRDGRAVIPRDHEDRPLEPGAAPREVEEQPDRLIRVVDRLQHRPPYGADAEDDPLHG